MLKTYPLVQARGEVHHDRRLHQMMLREDLRAWDLRRGSGGCGIGSARSSVDRDSVASSMERASLMSEPAPVPAPLPYCASSPTDSASSLHAVYGLDAEDATPSLFR